MQASVTVFDVQEKRSACKETIKPDMVEHLVFLDESGVNTDMIRRLITELCKRVEFWHQ